MTSDDEAQAIARRLTKAQREAETHRRWVMGALYPSAPFRWPVYRIANVRARAAGMEAQHGDR